jgi:hypothetical protein
VIALAALSRRTIVPAKASIAAAPIAACGRIDPHAFCVRRCLKRTWHLKLSSGEPSQLQRAPQAGPVFRCEPDRDFSSLWAPSADVGAHRKRQNDQLVAMAFIWCARVEGTCAAASISSCRRRQRAPVNSAPHRGHRSGEQGRHRRGPATT